MQCVQHFSAGMQRNECNTCHDAMQQCFGHQERPCAPQRENGRGHALDAAAMDLRRARDDPAQPVTGGRREAVPELLRGGVEDGRVADHGTVVSNQAILVPQIVHRVTPDSVVNVKNFPGYMHESTGTRPQARACRMAGQPQIVYASCCHSFVARLP